MANTSVDRFIYEHITSVEQLEFLLLMRQRPHAWTAEQLAAELRTSLGSATAKLRDLAERGFIQPDQALADAFVYSPPGDVQVVVTELARQYHERRVAIITQIYTKGTPDLTAFSDAFRLRKPQQPSPPERPLPQQEKKDKERE